MSLSKLNPSLTCQIFPELLENRDLLPWEMRYALIQAVDNFMVMDKSAKRTMVLNVSDRDLDVFVQARALKLLG